MALKDTPTIPIAELRPDIVEGVDERYIRGIVTLIWPYASSKESMSLLLVEPDFRLPACCGQVRIDFNNASANAVSRADIGCGDQLLLSLKGARWTKDGSTTCTPGKSIEWELQFSRILRLEVRKDSKAGLTLTW